MSPPNLKTPSVVTGKGYHGLLGTSLDAAVVNAADSGAVIRLVTVRVANITSTSGRLDVSVYRGGTHFYLAKNIDVPSRGTLVISDKVENIYLEEGDSLYAKAAASNSLHLNVNYEIIA